MQVEENILQIVICDMDTFVTVYSCHGIKSFQIQTGFEFGFC